MASTVDICNLALAHLGDEAAVASIDPPDGSVQASHCQRFYPVARNALLEMHEWNFATKRAALIEIETDEIPGAWTYAYAWPTSCLRPVRILADGATDDNDGEDFVCETLSNGTKVIFSGTADASLVFIATVTDTAKYTGLFTTALARLLSSYLAGPILKGQTGRTEGQAHLKQFLQVDFLMATQADAKARRVNVIENFTPGAIAARA